MHEMRRTGESPIGGAAPAAIEKTRKSRGGRKRFGILLAVFLLGCVVWFAPTIVARTSLRHAVLSAATRGFEGRISTGSMSLGWFSPVVVRDLAASGADGQALVVAAELRSAKSLLAILVRPSELGTMRLQSPRLSLALRPGGSNFEDALAGLLRAEPRQTATRFDATIEIVDGGAEITDAETGERWQVEQLQASLLVALGSVQPLSAKVRCGIVGEVQPDRLGQCEADISCLCDEGAAGAISEVHVALRAHGLAIDVLQPLLKRFSQDVRPRGVLACDAEYQWHSAARHSIGLRSLNVEGLSLAAPTYLGTDTLNIDRGTCIGRLELDDRRLRFQDVVLQSDVVAISADGVLRLDALLEPSPLSMIRTLLSDEDCRVAGQLDVARLSAVMPATLRIRDGTTITSGNVQFRLSSQPRGEGRHWDAVVEASNLAATNRGNRISWQDPVRLTLTAHDASEGIVIDGLRGESSFLDLDGRGTATDGFVRFRGDLDRLVGELEQFVDMGVFRLGGAVDGDVRWQRGHSGRFDASGMIQLREFQCVIPERPAWREELLSISLSADGVADQTRVVSLENASLRVSSGGDTLDAQLVEPLAGLAEAPSWPVQCQLRGSLATWGARVRPWFSLAGWDIGGTVDLQTTCRVAARSVEISPAVLDLRQFHLHGSGVFIDEPQLRVITAARYESASNSLALGPTTLESSSLALRAEGVSLKPDEKWMAVEGDVGYRADLSRLGRWFADPLQHQARPQWAGMANGRLQVSPLTPDGEEQRVQWSATIADLAYIAPPQRPADSARVASVQAAASQRVFWSEPKVVCEGKLDYQFPASALSLANFVLDAGESLKISAQGRLADVGRQCRVDLRGTMSYDLQRVSAVLQPTLGRDFHVEGRDSREFSIRGPLRTVSGDGELVPINHSVSLQPATSPVAATMWPAELAAKASLGWTGGAVQGVTFGAGNLQAELANGKVLFQPMYLDLSEGRLVVTPRIEFDREPSLLVFDPGSVVQQVRISPEMCSAWLKYVAPPVAYATRAEGRFSVELERAAVPLSAPDSANVRGVVTIHAGEIGPGPLSQELIWLGQQIKAIAEQEPAGLVENAARTWLQLPEQKIEFQMAEGQVHHRGLQLGIGDVVVRTYGSVSLDQSLSLVVDVPLQERWFKDSRLQAIARGQSLQVPLRGTLSKPQFDRRAALQQLSQQVIGRAAGNLLEDQLNRGLNRLFGPPAP